MIFPNGVTKDPDVDAITSGQFQKVFSDELLRLPGKIVGVLPIDWKGLYKDPQQGQALEEILAQLADDLFQIPRQSNETVLKFLVDLEAHVARQGGGRQVPSSARSRRATRRPRLAC